MKKRVLHIRSTIGMYGAERVVANMMPVLTNLYEYASCYLIQGDDLSSNKLASLLIDNRIDVKSTISKKKFDFDLIKSIRSEVTNNNVNIVHTHDYKSLIHTTLAVMGLGIKKVHHVHGALGNTKSEKFYAFVENIFKLFVHRILFVNSSSTKNKAGFNNKTHFLANGIPTDATSEARISSKILRIVMVARFTPEKNHKLAIDIADELRNLGANFKLTMLGDGDLLEEIKALTKKRNLEDFVQFTGFVDDVPKWLAQSDLQLITSTTEGMPMGLLEAMSLGIPAVSTPVGSIPEIIKRSKSGALAETNDQFVSVLTKYINSPNTLSQESALATSYVVENLSVEKQVENLSEIYDEILGLDCA